MKEAAGPSDQQRSVRARRDTRDALQRFRDKVESGRRPVMSSARSARATTAGATDSAAPTTARSLPPASQPARIPHRLVDVVVAVDEDREIRDRRREQQLERAASVVAESRLAHRGAQLVDELGDLLGMDVHAEPVGERRFLAAVVPADDGHQRARGGAGEREADGRRGSCSPLASA